MNEKEKPQGESILWKVKEERYLGKWYIKWRIFAKAYVENSVVQLNTTGIQTVKVMDIEPCTLDHTKSDLEGKDADSLANLLGNE